MRDRLLMRRRVGDWSVHPPRRHNMQQLEAPVLSGLFCCRRRSRSRVRSARLRAFPRPFSCPCPCDLATIRALLCLLGGFFLLPTGVVFAPCIQAHSSAFERI